MNNVTIYLGGVQDTQEFRNRIANELPDNCGEVDVWWCGIQHSKRGGYEHVLDLRINGEELTLKWHTNDSASYDLYRDMVDDSNYGSEDYQEFMIAGCEWVISRNFDQISELCQS